MGGLQDFTTYLKKNLDMDDQYIKSFELVFFTLVFLALLLGIALCFYVIFSYIRKNYGFRRNRRRRSLSDSDSDGTPQQQRIQSDRNNGDVRVNINVGPTTGAAVGRSHGRDRFVIRAELGHVLLHVQQMERYRNDREQIIRRVLPEPQSYRSHERTMNLTECAICLEEFAGDDECRVLPSCRHIFHLRCVDTWLMVELTCPICRTNVIAGDEA